MCSDRDRRSHVLHFLFWLSSWSQNSNPPEEALAEGQLRSGQLAHLVAGVKNPQQLYVTDLLHKSQANLPTSLLLRFNFYLPRFSVRLRKHFVGVKIPVQFSTNTWKFPQVSLKTPGFVATNTNRRWSNFLSKISVQSGQTSFFKLINIYHTVHIR